VTKSFITITLQFLIVAITLKYKVVRIHSRSVLVQYKAVDVYMVLAVYMLQHHS